MTEASSPTSRKPIRVAIVGSGLTGLVATYLLSAGNADSTQGAPRIRVEIFERASTLGMDSASISVPLASPKINSPVAPPPLSPHRDDDDGTTLRSRKRLRIHTHAAGENDERAERSMRIDVPMRAFTGGYYPQLLALYRHLGIRTNKTNFTYSFATLPASTMLPEPGSSSSTRSSSPSWRSSVSSTEVDVDDPKAIPTPTPSILYNGANGVRGIGIPSNLKNADLLSPIRISNLVSQIVRLHTYFASLLLLVFGYFQLLMIAVWHHKTGHTTDTTHPLRSRTLRDLVSDPFPTRKTAPASVLGRLEVLIEALLRRLLTLDERFAEQTLAPLFSAVMTCALDSVWAAPATEVLDYVALTLGKDHFVVKDGVRTVVAALLTHVALHDTTMQDTTNEKGSEGGEEPRSRVWTRAEVRKVEQRDGMAWLNVVHHVQGGDEGQMSRQPSSSSTDRTLIEEEANTAKEHGPFDHVIFATQANQTLRFLQTYVDSLAKEKENQQEAERLEQVIEKLNKFKYEKSAVVNHTDRGLLPRQESDWRDLNLVSRTRLDFAGSRKDEKRSKQWVEELRRNSNNSLASASAEWTDEERDGGEAGSCWSSSDTLLHGGSSASDGHTMATHVLVNQDDGHEGSGGGGGGGGLLVMQTTNPLAGLWPREQKVLSKSTFERAVIDVPAHIARHDLFSLSSPSPSKEREKGAKGVERVEVQTAGGRSLSLGSLQAIQNHGRAGVWVCGSWAMGIPLLEGCVVSAKVVAQEILNREGVALPNHALW